MTQPDACEASAPGTRILYIDDDPSLGRLVEKSLSRKGFDVALAGSGDEGLQRLASETFKVVALDHYMPGRDGLATLEAIQALTDPPPVIYVTGTDEGRIAVAALKAGAFDYVVKDVSGVFLELLCSAVDQAIDAAELRRQKAEAERAMVEAKDRAELLLREVNHRVANSLSLVSALVHMQAGSLQEGEARQALLETQNRIAAIAGVHRRLYTSADVSAVELDAYLHSLVDELSLTMISPGSRCRIRLDADQVSVPTDRAVSIGVIVTELVTNACKYAYPAEGGGEIRVRLGSVSPGEASLTVEDDGIGWRGEGPIKGSGLGSKIVKAMAASLQAPVTYDLAHQGTRVGLIFRVLIDVE